MGAGCPGRGSGVIDPRANVGWVTLSWEVVSCRRLSWGGGGTAGALKTRVSAKASSETSGPPESDASGGAAAALALPSVPGTVALRPGRNSAGGTLWGLAGVDSGGATMDEGAGSTCVRSPAGSSASEVRRRNAANSGDSSSSGAIPETARLSIAGGVTGACPPGDISGAGIAASSITAGDSAGQPRLGDQSAPPEDWGGSTGLGLGAVEEPVVTPASPPVGEEWEGEPYGNPATAPPTTGCISAQVSPPCSRNHSARTWATSRAD